MTKKLRTPNIRSKLILEEEKEESTSGAGETATLTNRGGHTCRWNLSQAHCSASEGRHRFLIQASREKLREFQERLDDSTREKRPVCTRWITSLHKAHLITGFGPSSPPGPTRASLADEDLGWRRRSSGQQGHPLARSIGFSSRDFHSAQRPTKRGLRPGILGGTSSRENKDQIAAIKREDKGTKEDPKSDTKTLAARQGFTTNRASLYLRRYFQQSSDLFSFT